MSLARAFTMRSKRPERIQTQNTMPQRAESTRKPGKPINRSKISLPTGPVQTSNTTLFENPDIATLRGPLSSNSSLHSRRSGDDSDAHTASTPGSLTDASSIDSPSSPSSPKPNHLSTYFMMPTEDASVPPVPPVPAPRKATSTTSLKQKVALQDESPALPQRALSHSKRAHEQLARARSMHSMNSNSNSARSSREYCSSREQRSSKEQRSSGGEQFKLSMDGAHPFGKELEQLNEIQEEFTHYVTDADMDADFLFMRNHGLYKFCADDYLAEITPLSVNTFDKRSAMLQAGWI